MYLATSTYALFDIDRDPAAKTAKPSLIFRHRLAFSTLENGKWANSLQGQSVSFIHLVGIEIRQWMTFQLSSCPSPARK